jgi:hypothetical protein
MKTNLLSPYYYPLLTTRNFFYFLDHSKQAITLQAFFFLFRHLLSFIYLYQAIIASKCSHNLNTRTQLFFMNFTSIVYQCILNLYSNCFLYQMHPFLLMFIWFDPLSCFQSLLIMNFSKNYYDLFKTLLSLDYLLPFISNLDYLTMIY